MDHVLVESIGHQGAPTRTKNLSNIDEGDNKVGTDDPWNDDGKARTSGDPAADSYDLGNYSGNTYSLYAMNHVRWFQQKEITLFMSKNYLQYYIVARSGDIIY